MFGSEGLKTNLSGIVSLRDIWLTIFGTMLFCRHDICWGKRKYDSNSATTENKIKVFNSILTDRIEIMVESEFNVS